MNLRVIHIVAGLWKDTGGPAEVIPNLCRAQAKAGAEVTLCSFEGDIAPQVRDLRLSDVKLRLFRPLDSTVRYSPDMESYLKSRHGIDIIHNHGHWLWPNWLAGKMARHLNARLVSTPHGTLVPGMLERSRFKKQIAWAFADKRLIARSDIVHALSRAEQEAMIPKLGRHASKVLVIPNGVNFPTDAGQNTNAAGGTLLFLSRVSPIKGVVQLLDAWKNLSPRFPNWRLRIVGPIDESLRNVVKSLCAGTERVELAGPIYHDDRWTEYRQAAAFILPTLGEGLPTVLLEAAAHRLPVITTPEANFTELSQVGGSLLTPPDPANIEAALTRFFEMPGDERHAMGQRGAKLIQEHYDWAAIAMRWLSAYSNITRR